jgi:hypothetical protein
MGIFYVPSRHVVAHAAGDDADRLAPADHLRQPGKRFKSSSDEAARLAAAAAESRASLAAARGLGDATAVAQKQQEALKPMWSYTFSFLFQ